MPLCSELMSRPKKAVAGYRPERTTPGGPSRAGRGRQYCTLRWLLSPKPEFSKCIFELKMPRPVIWKRSTSTNSYHEPPLLCVYIRDAPRGTGLFWGGSMIVLSIPHRLRGPTRAVSMRNPNNELANRTFDTTGCRVPAGGVLSVDGANRHLRPRR